MARLTGDTRVSAGVVRRRRRAGAGPESAANPSPSRQDAEAIESSRVVADRFVLFRETPLWSRAQSVVG